MKIVKKRPVKDLTRYTPMRSMLDDFFTVPSMFDDFFDRSFTAKNLFVDLWEEDDSYFVKMAVPGVNKDDIAISISENSVTIKAETKKEEEKEEDDKKKYYYKALESSFEQTFNLPGNVSADTADAKYENGVLTLKLPKTEETKPKQVRVN